MDTRIGHYRVSGSAPLVCIGTAGRCRGGDPRSLVRCVLVDVPSRWESARSGVGFTCGDWAENGPKTQTDSVRTLFGQPADRAEGFHYMLGGCGKKGKNIAILCKAEAAKGGVGSRVVICLERMEKGWITGGRRGQAN